MNFKKHEDFIELTDGPFQGVLYTYGKVQLVEEQDYLRLKFSYDIIDDNEMEIDKDQFHQYIGDILQDLIYEGVARNTIVYTGGVDEDRDSDYRKSDHE